MDALLKVKTRVFEFPIYIPPEERSSGILLTLMSGKLWEETETLSILKLHRALNFKQFVDVGANIGYYTYMLSSAGIDTIAIEPVPNLANALQRTVDELKLPVEVLNVACWSSIGEVEINVSVVPGWSSIGNARFERTVFKKEKVLALPLDNITAGKKVDFVKIDVEGAEEEVLKGAHNTITGHDDIILMLEFTRAFWNGYGWIEYVKDVYPDLKLFSDRLMPLKFNEVKEICDNMKDLDSKNFFLSRMDLDHVAK